MIHEFTVCNTTQSATAACLDGTNATTATVAAGQYCVPGDVANQAALQFAVDQTAHAAALKAAQDELAATAACLSRAWCCVATCTYNPATGNNDLSYTFTPDVLSSQCAAAFNQGKGWVKAGAFNNDTDAQNLAQQIAVANINNGQGCLFTNDELWTTAVCGGTPSACVYTAPDTTGKLFVHIPAATPEYYSRESKGKSNSMACTAAQVQLTTMLSTKCAADCKAKLKGLTWLLPSTVPDTPLNRAATTTPCAGAVEFSTQINCGEIGATYVARLWIRGCVECKDYYGSAADLVTTSNGFCRVCLGGPGHQDPTYCESCCVYNDKATDPSQPLNPNQVPRPGNTYPVANQYMLVISDPPQIYYLNNLPAGASQGQVYGLDGTALITAPGTHGEGYYIDNVLIKQNATVTLRADSRDGLEYNTDYFKIYTADDNSDYPLNLGTKPDNTPVEQPYFGQFMQMDCVDLQKQ
jgi:hypothetical protein